MYKYCVFIILFLIHINIFSQNIIDTTFIIHSYQDTIDINNSEILYIKLLIDTNKLINNQILDIENQKIYINIDTSIHLPFTYRCRLRYIKKKYLLLFYLLSTKIHCKARSYHLFMLLYLKCIQKKEEKYIQMVIYLVV